MEYFSIPQLVIKTTICDNTIRRYTRRFPDFFIPKPFEGVKKFPQGADKMIKRIYHLYTKEGKRREEVRAILKEEFADMMIQPEPEVKEDDVQADTSNAVSMDGFADAMKNALIETITTVTERNDKVHELEEKVNAQASIIIGLQNQLNEVLKKIEVMEATPKVVHPDDYKKQIIERIIDMKDNQEMTYTEIVEVFNKEGVRTFSGQGNWNVGTLSKFYKKAVEHG